MTHDQIKDLARESGLSFIPEANCPLVRIVQKAVAIEREACADLCTGMALSPALGDIEKYRTNFIADAIRERGNS